MHTNQKPEDLFWNEIDTNTDCKKYTEMYPLLKEHKCYFEFYNLCKAFLDVALNADKNIDYKNLNVQGVFHDSDINKAITETKQFIFTFNIQKIDELLSVIKLFYPNAANCFDKRQQDIIFYKKSPSSLFPKTGTYVDFCMIPENIWAEITDLILSNNR